MAYDRQFYVGNDKKYTCEEDLDEEKVWNSMMEKKDYILKEGKNKESFLSSLPGHPRTTGENKTSRQSAPINIPERPKLCRNKIVGESSFQYGDGSWGVHQFYDGFEEEEYGGNDGAMIPPHEWIEKRAATRQVSSFSMCEGIGRTLKGRDLRRVRNAVLARTGFLE